MAETIVEGLELAPTAVIGAAATPTRPMTEYDNMCDEICRRIAQDQPKAALASAVDLVNSIAGRYNLNGFAQL